MKLRAKVRIDAWGGAPVVALLNVLALLLGKVMSRDHRIDNTRTIVVCKLMGLGSIVQAAPLLATLRARFPGSRILILTVKTNAGLCSRLGAVDEVLGIDDASLAGVLRSGGHALLALWRRRVDLFINLEMYSNIGALLSVCSVARNRIGYYLAPRDMRAKGIYTHMVYFNQGAPISEIYLQAAHCIGCDDAAIPGRALRVTRRDTADLDGVLRGLAGASAGAPYVVVNPNASDLMLERRWPTGRFSALLSRLLAAHPDWNFFIIGIENEAPIARRLLDGIQGPRERVFDLSGRLSLFELMALIDGARVMVTNDSGPMHVAFSLDTPTVALFGPVTPGHYGGTSVRKAVLYKKVYCSPCTHHFLDAPCHGDNQCMQLITVDEVVDAFRSVADGAGETRDAIPYIYQAQSTVLGVQRRAAPGE